MIIYEIMAVYNSTQVLLNVYEVCAILYDMVSSDFHLDTLSGASVFLMITFGDDAGLMRHECQSKLFAT